MMQSELSKTNNNAKEDAIMIMIKYVQYAYQSQKNTKFLRPAVTLSVESVFFRFINTITKRSSVHFAGKILHFCSSYFKAARIQSRLRRVLLLITVFSMTLTVPWLEE